MGPASVISGSVLNCTICLCPAGALWSEEVSDDNGVNSGAVGMVLPIDWKIAGVTVLGTEDSWHGSTNGMSRWMQAFCGIKLPCSGTR